MSLHAGYQLTRQIRHEIYPAIAVDRSDLAFQGGSVLVTGGGSGIGLATAKAFAQAGASTVIIAGRRLERLEEAVEEVRKTRPETRVVPMVTDISDTSSIRLLWENVNEQVGKIDVLVNNAGKGADAVLIGDGAVEDWWSVQQTNMLGTYAMTDAYLDSLAASDESGTLINVVSAAALFEQAGSSAYSISKFATVKLTQFVHTESPHVRAFSVHPGIVATDMTGDMGSQALDTVDLAAAFNLYLASSRADYLRGRFVAANWDVEEMEAHRDQISAGKLLQFGIHAELGPQAWHGVVG